MILQTFSNNFALLVDAPNGPPELRELVLQLAVQGKLVLQDEREESAALLAQRIEREKVRLVNKKSLKFSETMPVSDDEAPYAIPENWLWTRLANVGLVNPRNDFDDSQMASFVPMNLVPQKYGETVKTKTRCWAEIRRGFTHFAEGDVVLAKITPCFENGKGAVIRGLENGIGAGTTELHVFRPVGGFICPEYVLAYLKSPRFVQDGVRRMTGTAGQKRLPSDYFAQNPFPLPPLQEQKRIVAKAEELMRVCDDLEAKQQARRESRACLNSATLAPLNNAASLLAEEFEQAVTRLADNFETLYDSAENVGKLRSTILQLAVQGKLVPQDPRDEPASVLLSEIRKMKDALPDAVLGKRDSREARVCDDDSLPPLPVGWEWSRLEDALISLRNGLAIPPQNFGNTRLLRISALRPNTVNIREFRYLPEAPDKYEGFKIEAGDLLFTRYSGNRDFVGICGVVPPFDEPLVHPDKLIRGCLIRRGLLPHFVSIAMNTGVSRSFVEKHLKTTAGQVGIAGRELKMTPVPVPPLAEQQRIVGKVNQLMALCDELEVKLRRAEVDGEKLLNAAVQHLLEAVREAPAHEATSEFVNV